MKKYLSDEDLRIKEVLKEKEKNNPKYTFR